MCAGDAAAAAASAAAALELQQLKVAAERAEAVTSGLTSVYTLRSESAAALGNKDYTTALSKARSGLAALNIIQVTACFDNRRDSNSCECDNYHSSVKCGLQTEATKQQLETTSITDTSSMC
jgi:hypothetical protein